MNTERNRLDQLLVRRGLVPTRSQAESWIKLGKVRVNGVVATKPGQPASAEAQLELLVDEQYVSRAGLKLASVAQALDLQFQDAVVLDVGSSTGGFTDFALRRGARKVIAVDVGTEQLHPSLRTNPRVELHEQTDIRTLRSLSETPDLVLIDVSFISLRDVLPHLATLCGPKTRVAAMLKPQFEAGAALKNKGVIKNDAMRRTILKEFEQWVRRYFLVLDKADSEVAGSKGNRERFYLLGMTKSLAHEAQN